MSAINYYKFLIYTYIRKCIHSCFNIHFYKYDVCDDNKTRTCQCCDKTDVRILFNTDYLWLSYQNYNQMKKSNAAADNLQKSIDEIYKYCGKN